MATVHLGRLHGAGGFSKTVAIKCMHPQLARDPDFVESFLDEARMASRIHHNNVVATLDVLAKDDELFMVMEYVVGEPLSRLLQVRPSVPIPIACAIVRDLLRGLHAAHEARGDDGEPLDLVHRDVSPQNVLVGVDGVARVLDFGIAKAVGSRNVTEKGVVKGKAAYMAPEQIYGEPLSRRADIYGAGAVLWELLVGKPLYPHGSDAAALAKALELPIEAPGMAKPGIEPQLDAIVMRALERDADARYPDATTMASELTELGELATPEQVGVWVQDLAEDTLERRAVMLETARQLLAKDEPAPDDTVPDSPRDLPSAPRAEPSTEASNLRRGRVQLVAAGLGAILIVFGVALRLGESAPTESPQDPVPINHPTRSVPTQSEVRPPVTTEPQVSSSLPPVRLLAPSPSRTSPSPSSTRTVEHPTRSSPPAPTLQPTSSTLTDSKKCRVEAVGIDAKGHTQYKKRCD